MPTLGFLKKKRTKDSQGSIESPSSPTRDSPITHTISKTTTASSGDHQPTNAATISQTPSEPVTSHSATQHKPADSMQAIAYQQPYSNNPQQQQQLHQSNAASIQNIINQPSQAQNQSSHIANGQPPEQNKQVYQQAAANPVRETKGKYTLTDFVIQRTLGTGSFGRVHLVQSKHNQRFYAVKVLKKAQVVKMKQVEHTNDERRMLQKVKHPFLITLWGTFQDAKNLYMVMDFIEGGELFSLLRKSQVGYSTVCQKDISADHLGSDSPTLLPNSTPQR